MSYGYNQYHSLGNRCSGARKTALSAAIAATLSGGAVNALADLTTPGATLLFDAGTVITTGCTFGNFTGSSCTNGGSQIPTDVTDVGGSWFRMNNSGTPSLEKTALSMFTRPGNSRGIILGQTFLSSGQHVGLPDGSESPAIDAPWPFFNNTGMHNLAVPVTQISDLASVKTLDFSGWGVNWGNFGPGGLEPTIPMGAPTTPPSGPPGDVGGPALVVCTPADCSDGSTYTLDTSVHVPQAFPSVAYTLHLEGTVALPGTVTTEPDTATTIVNNPVVIPVLANDFSADNLDDASVIVVTPAGNGSTSTLAADGTVTYSPDTPPGFVGTDTFQYTVDSAAVPPVTSAATDVTVDVQTNVAPVATNDTGSVSTAVLDAVGSNTVNVLANDTDVNNAPGLPGGIDVATVTVIGQSGPGTCAANTDGTITYTQTPPSVVATHTCTYTVSDSDNSAAAALTSASATLTTTVVEQATDWPVGLSADIIPILFFEAGVPGDPSPVNPDTSIPPLSGSYFTMQITQETLIYTVMAPATSGGVVVGHDQPAGNSHIDPPTGFEETVIDLGWSFFGNTGFSYSKNGGISDNGDGRLRFSNDAGIGNGQGKYIITWSGIPAIDLGGSVAFPEDLGIAGIGCNPAPCADQSTYVLDYAAHVPPGDPSGFGAVPYTLHLEGTVGFLDNALATSNGNIVTETRLSADSVIASDPDPDVIIQCAGDCFDYTINNVTASSASIVLPLAGGVPLNPVWRILDNGIWRSFDTTADTIKSAPFAPGDTNCPAPGAAAYGALTSGHVCIELTIEDNGPNDLDPATGTIRDPSGMGSGGSAGGGTVFEDTRGSNSSGCSIVKSGINPLRRGEWWLLAGFMAWLGWRGRSRQH